VDYPHPQPELLKISTDIHGYWKQLQIRVCGRTHLQSTHLCFGCDTMEADFCSLVIWWVSR